jgi:hypothetical protein
MLFEKKNCRLSIKKESPETKKEYPGFQDSENPKETQRQRIKKE